MQLPPFAILSLAPVTYHCAHVMCRSATRRCTMRCWGATPNALASSCMRARTPQS
jgi:hypothetical protein